MAKLTGKFVTWSLIVLGLILMATPLALWIAWSETVFFVILLTAGVAVTLYCYLVEHEPPPDPQPSGPPYHRLEAWVDEMFARLQRLNPIAHPNRLTGTARFNTAMDRLKDYLFNDRGRY